MAENDEKYHKSHKVIAVNGYWYNVAGFMKYHPGGPVIEKFVGADITTTFYGIHRNPDDILSGRRPVAKVKLDKDGLRNYKENRDYWLLYQRYKSLGLFVPNQTWLTMDMIKNAIIFAIALYSFYYYPSNAWCNGAMIGHFYVQGGFLNHDAGHRLLDSDTDKCYQY